MSNTLPLPPGPTTRGETRATLGLFQRDILGAFDHMADRYGDLSMVRLGPARIIVVRGAEASRHVLVSQQDRYPKAKQFDLFRALLGNGLVTSRGEEWRTSRTLVQPMFAKRHLVPFADHMAAAAADAMDGWERAWPADHRVDVAKEILHVGLDTVGRALVSHDFSEDGAAFESGMADALVEIGRMSRSRGVFIGQDLPGFGIVRAAKLSTPRRWRRYEDRSARAAAVIEAIVDDRLRHGHGDRRDLVRLLMETRDDETGATLGRQQVVDEVMTFVAAGHETTAHGLSWMFHLLARNPEARERLHTEVDGVLGGRVPDAADVDRLPWLTACFQEGMRIYPPVWHLPRIAAEEDEIAGFRIPKDSRMMVAVWSTHRDPAVWPDPLRFDPSRWLDGAHKDRPRFSYLPFGGGRRACIGQGFAMMNAVILGAMMAQRFRFDGVPGAEIAIEPTITLRPRDGIPMRVSRRTAVVPA